VQSTRLCGLGKNANAIAHGGPRRALSAGMGRAIGTPVNSPPLRGRHPSEIGIEADGPPLDPSSDIAEASYYPTEP